VGLLARAVGNSKFIKVF